MKKGEMGWNEILEKRKLGSSALQLKIFISFIMHDFCYRMILKNAIKF